MKDQSSMEPEAQDLLVQIKRLTQITEDLESAVEDLESEAKQADRVSREPKFYNRSAELVDDAKYFVKKTNERLTNSENAADLTSGEVWSLTQEMEGLAREGEHLLRQVVGIRREAESFGQVLTKPEDELAGPSGPPADEPPATRVEILAVRSVIEQGERVSMIVRVDPSRDDYTFRWSASAGELFGEEKAVVWDTANANPGVHKVRVRVEPSIGTASRQFTVITATAAGARNAGLVQEIEQVAVHLKSNLDQQLDRIASKTGTTDTATRPALATDPSRVTRVRLEPSTPEWKASRVQGELIRRGAERMSYHRYEEFVSRGLRGARDSLYRSLDSYERLRELTDDFMVQSVLTRADVQGVLARLRGEMTPEEFDDAVRNYVDRDLGVVPSRYLADAARRIGLDQNRDDRVLLERVTQPLFIELIWSYWHEEGMLVQTLNAISLRFQNKRLGAGPDALMRFDIDPLRPLSNLLWGYIQDTQHRLTVKRRAYEYEHHYGLSLIGKATRDVRPADRRSNFLEAFHGLLHLCSLFYKELDDNTIRADPFPLLNALRDVHLIIAEGAHNQYGDLPWTARREMLMEQWLLARPEMHEFLGGRRMVVLPEPWMDRVDTMKRLVGWSDVSVLQFHNLAVWGEELLLGIRFHPWADPSITPPDAGSWAVDHRAAVQGYIHAYRASTGVDLTSDPVDNTTPSVLLQQRLTSQPSI